MLAAVPRGLAHRDAAWAMLLADAHRGLREFDEALHIYDQGIARGERAAEAGYLAASVRFHRLGQPREALRTLASSGATERGAVLEERAVALRVQILRQLHRGEEAAAAARQHRHRFGLSSAR